MPLRKMWKWTKYWKVLISGHDINMSLGAKDDNSFDKSLLFPHTSSFSGSHFSFRNPYLLRRKLHLIRTPTTISHSIIHSSMSCCFFSVIESDLQKLEWQFKSYVLLRRAFPRTLRNTYHSIIIHNMVVSILFRPASFLCILHVIPLYTSSYLPCLNFHLWSSSLLFCHYCLTSCFYKNVNIRLTRHK